MPSFILDLLKFNQNIDYTILIPIVILYFLAFWLIVSIWVGRDAKKRMQKSWKALAMFFGNLIFGLPFLILYLLIRPLDEEQMPLESWQPGGVNVPIVNFVGKEGVVMSLELRINSEKVAKEQASEMKIDVSFDTQDELKKLVAPTDNKINPTIVITETVQNNKLTGIKGRFNAGLSHIKKLWNRSGKSKQSGKEDQKNEQQTAAVDQVNKNATGINPTSEKKQKKKHKKHH